MSRLLLAVVFAMAVGCSESPTDPVGQTPQTVEMYISCAASGFENGHNAEHVIYHGPNVEFLTSVFPGEIDTVSVLAGEALRSVWKDETILTGVWKQKDTTATEGMDWWVSDD